MRIINDGPMRLGRVLSGATLATGCLGLLACGGGEDGDGGGAVGPTAGATTLTSGTTTAPGTTTGTTGGTTATTSGGTGTTGVATTTGGGGGGSTLTSGTVGTTTGTNTTGVTTSTATTTTTTASTTGTATTGGSTTCTDSGAHDDFSFFVTSYFHIADLSGSENGFGGDLRYNGAATGLEGADAICQEIANRVCFGHRTWRAYLSTSTVNAIDRIGTGPWYDYSGALVANDIEGLLSGNRAAGGALETGTYDELGTFHDGSTDVNNDGQDDDDHDTMTATLEDGTYAGFSCDDWTSTTATMGGGGQGGPGQGGPGGGGGIMMGHSWPAQSGQHWSESHAGHQCAAGVNFIQDGAGDSATVGGGGGYGGFYCFALPL